MLTKRASKKESTREAILAAARTVLASDGPEALSLSKVAHLAGINRGTAYQHFKTREELIKATIGWVSEHLCTTLGGGVELDESGRMVGIEQRSIYEVIARLVDFAVENPALGRIWLFDVLSSENPADDPFFRQFKLTTQRLADSHFSQDGIDVEALSVIILGGYFLWPEWTRAKSRGEEDRRAAAQRMRREILRLFLHGVLRPEEFPQLETLLSQEMLRS